MYDGICSSALLVFALAPGVLIYFLGMAPPDLSAQEKVSLRLQVFATVISWPVFLLYALSSFIGENALTGEPSMGVPSVVLFCMYIACTIFVGVASIAGQVSIVMLRGVPFPVRGPAAGVAGGISLVISVFFAVLVLS